MTATDPANPTDPTIPADPTYPAVPDDAVPAESRASYYEADPLPRRRLDRRLPEPARRFAAPRLAEMGRVAAGEVSLRARARGAGGVARRAGREDARLLRRDGADDGGGAARRSRRDGARGGAAGGADPHPLGPQVPVIV